MIAALGLDLSLTASGVARADGQLVTLEPPTTDPARRLWWIAKTITEHLTAGPPAVVMVERIAGPHAGTNIKLAHLHGVVMLRRFELGRDEPVIEVGSSELKKYATGYGKADKEQVIECALARATAQGLPLPSNADESDAFWLRQIGIDAHDSVYRAGLFSGDSRDKYRMGLLTKLFGAVV